MGVELIRIVDGLAREKNIDKELVLSDLEEAMKSAIRKKYGQEEGVTVTIDRLSGDIAASLDDEPINMDDLGRIAAQTAKQVMIQRFREAERGSIFEEFVELFVPDSMRQEAASASTGEAPPESDPA